MNFSKLKYKSLLIGAGASMLLATSCKDFLDVDVYDQYSASALSSKKAYQSLTTTLYGGKVWSQYEGKFAWCVNEGVPGILFNVNDQEGALFLLSIGDDNSILKEGYTSLYSGVISTCNQVIKIVSDSLDAGKFPSDMNEADMKAVMAEARLFRGYAHFLATEYFGEVPLVLNSEKDITNNVTLPLVSRGTVYESVVQDLVYAYENLPEPEKTDAWRANKYSAAAMLAKVYLTMASCRFATAGLFYPYVCPDPDNKAREAVRLLTEVINSNKFALESHANIFSAEKRSTPSSESVFSLYWKMGAYGEGSQYQSQMAMSGDWSPGSGWGSGKGLTYTLYNSFDENDARKKEICFFVGNGTGNEYVTATGQKSWYGSDFKAKKAAGQVEFGMTGTDFLSQGQHLMNNIKKFVWGVNGTSFHSVGMSIDRRQDIIRLSDVYFMRAEANMLLLQPLDLVTPCTDASVLADINKVLSAHGAPEITELAYFQDFEAKHPATEVFPFTVTVDDGNGGSASKTYNITPGVSMYHGEIRSDLVQQRRKEFAMEGHGWLDLKRFYYRNPDLAAKFMYQMDRSCCFTNSPEIPEGDARFEREDGYKRLALVNACNLELQKDYGDKYKEGDPEVEVYTKSFLERNQWFLPIPSSAKTYLNCNVVDLQSKVQDGTYEY